MRGKHAHTQAQDSHTSCQRARITRQLQNRSSTSQGPILSDCDTPAAASNSHMEPQRSYSVTEVGAHFSALPVRTARSRSDFSNEPGA